MWIVSFWIFPVISAGMWVAMLCAMIGSWAEQGTPIYASMEPGQTIAFISDIGVPLKPLFITGSAITVVFLDLSFLAERWLRHSGQLVQNKGKIDKLCAIGSICFAVAGLLGLILLSIYDTLHHPHVHDGLLIMFIVGYLISAILICIEYLRLGKHYRSQHIVLFISFCVKAAFVVIEIVLAIAFGASSHAQGKANASAVLEWVIAYIFTFYILSFVIDLLPSVRTKHHVPQGEKRTEMAHSGPSAPHPGDPEVGVAYEPPAVTAASMEEASVVGPDHHRGQRM